MDRKIKILHLGKIYPIKGGVEKVMYDLVEGISHNNIKCDMICASHSNVNTIIELNELAKIICCSTILKLFNTMISPNMIFQLKRICNEYDIIHIHHPDPMACISLILSRYKGKVVLHWHSDILSQKIMLKLFYPFQKWLIKRADLIIGTTPVYVKHSPYLKFSLNKCSFLPIGIDHIKSDLDKVLFIRNKYKGKKIIFSLGRLVEYKGFEYLIKAAIYLSDNHIILIGGEGSLKDKLNLLIRNNNLIDKVKLIGYISENDLPNYYAACDIFCLSSIWKTEAFGIVQIEAMSYGKPVIATDILGSGVSWVNKNGESGLNVPPADAKSLGIAINLILSDEELYKEYSNGAFSRYNIFFRNDIMIRKCIDLYYSLFHA